IKQDAFVLAAIDDHIAPWRSQFKTPQLVGGRTKFVLSSSGHIAGIVNPPSKSAVHWTNDRTVADPDLWLAGATKRNETWRGGGGRAGGGGGRGRGGGAQSTRRWRTRRERTSSPGRKDEAMKIDRGRVGEKSAPVSYTYGWKDVVVYALGVGAKLDELDYLFEKAGPRVLPTFAVVTSWAAPV